MKKKSRVDTETDVLPLMVKGLTNREIADMLKVKSNVIGWHVAKILDKFEAKTRTEAAYEAISQGYVKVEPTGDEEQ